MFTIFELISPFRRLSYRIYMKKKFLNDIDVDIIRRCQIEKLTDMLLYKTIKIGAGTEFSHVTQKNDEIKGRFI